MRTGLLLLLSSLPWISEAIPPPAPASKNAQAERKSGRNGQYPVRTFHSSKAQAPYLDVTKRSDECDDGRLYFLTPRGWKVPDPGPMILDGSGELIWASHFKNSYGGQAYDLKVQKYKGDEYLTFWLGDDTVRGHGAGHFYMLNSSYDLVHKLGATNSLYADLHDLVITPQGTALMVIFQPVAADVRPAGRKFNDLWNQAIWDCVFQEVDIESGELLYQWHASEHVNLTASYNQLDATADEGTQTNPYDWFHINSVQKDDLGNYLISSRNTHAIYYINGKTKDTIWTLGGKNNTFWDLSEGHAINFAWQHDARFVSPYAFPEIYAPPIGNEGWTTQLISIFDNAALDWDYTWGPPYSRGLLLELTYPNPSSPNPPESTSRPKMGTIKTAAARSPKFPPLSEKDTSKIKEINTATPHYTVRVVNEYVNPRNKLSSSTQGSMQLLPAQKSPSELRALSLSASPTTKPISRTTSALKDPHILLGYGINAVITEFSSNGTVICDARFGAETSWEKGDVQSYRAYRGRWAGMPRKPPSAVVRNRAVFVSWNGATNVTGWELQVSETGGRGRGGKGGESMLKSLGRSLSGRAEEKGEHEIEEREDSDWKTLTRVNKLTFETAIPLETLEKQLTRSQNYLRVVALDHTGARLPHGASGVMRRSLIPSFALSDKVGGLKDMLKSSSPSSSSPDSPVSATSLWRTRSPAFWAACSVLVLGFIIAMSRGGGFAAILLKVRRWSGRMSGREALLPSRRRID